MGSELGERTIFLKGDTRERVRRGGGHVVEEECASVEARHPTVVTY